MDRVGCLDREMFGVLNMRLVFRSFLAFFLLFGTASAQNIATPYKRIFNIVAYGAACDGVTDDTAAWQSLLAALNAAGGGSIQVPNCTTLVLPGEIIIPNNSSLIGQGLGSTIKWSGPALFDMFLVSMSGASQAAPSQYITIENITMDGGPTGAASYLLKAYYVAHAVITNVHCNSASAGWLDAVQLWDTRITNIQGDFCSTSPIRSAVFVGTASGTNLTVASVSIGAISPGNTITGAGISGTVTILSQPSGTKGGAGVYITSASTTASGSTITASAPPNSMRIRNSAASSGYGFSSDNSNQDFITNVRFESFYGSCFDLEAGVNSTEPPNGIYVINYKCESANVTIDPFFVIGQGVTASAFQNLYLFADSWSSGSTAVDLLVDTGTGNNVFNGIFTGQATANIIANPININTTFQESLSNLYWSSSAGAPTSNAILNITGGAQPVVSGFITGFPVIPSIKGSGSGTTATAVSGAATLNASSGIITSEGLTGATSYTLTLTNSLITAGSVVVITPTNSAGAAVSLLSMTPSAGQVVVAVSMSSLTGTVKFPFQVVN